MDAQPADRPEGLPADVPADIPLEDLAARLAAAQEDGQPFVLLLGGRLAEAAGVPPLAQTARRIFADIYQRDPDVAGLYLTAEMLAGLQDAEPAGPPAEPDAWGSALQGLLGGMSALARFSMLQRYLSRGVPVPRFYQDLARLLRDGYFNPVLTANLDTLLEEALNGVGLQRGLDYQVTVPGAPPPAEEAPIRISRLAGGPAEPPGQTLLTSLQVRHGLAGEAYPADLLLVGYDFDQPTLDAALRAYPGRLWVAHPAAGEHPALIELAHQRELQLFSGPTAEPQRFFGFLNTLLKVHGEQAGQDETGTAPAWPDAEQLETTYLRDQLRRSRNVLAGLEQQRALQGAASDELRQQIDYQQQQIELLADQLRPLAEHGEVVAQLLAEIASQAKKGGADHNSYLYLNYQARAVRRELEEGQANEGVIATAVEATRTLVERLPEGTVAAEQRQQLQALAATPWEGTDVG